MPFIIYNFLNKCVNQFHNCVKSVTVTVSVFVSVSLCICICIVFSSLFLFFHYFSALSSVRYRHVHIHRFMPRCSPEFVIFFYGFYNTFFLEKFQKLFLSHPVFQSLSVSLKIHMFVVFFGMFFFSL